MPTYPQLYRIQFYTEEINGTTEQVTVEITDTATLSDPAPEVIYLEGGADPVRLSTVNNDRTPFQAIIARNATLTFLSTADYNSTTFSAGTDDRFAVDIYTSSTTLFKGFLLMDEIEERFVNPAVAKNEVQLKAIDNIGTLKEQELKDTTGDALEDGHYSLLYYIQNCLARTGLSLPINIAWNIWEEHFDTSVSAIEQAYLHSLSFEKEIETKEDCYTVLDKIVRGLKARLFQLAGEWWLVRVHELRTSVETISRVTYAADGTLTGTYANHFIGAAVEAGSGLFLAYANGTTTVQRQHKYVKDRERFETPKEVPRNSSFTRGSFFGVLDPYTPLLSFANASAFPAEGNGNVFYKANDTGLYYMWTGGGYDLKTASAFHFDYWTLEKFGGGLPNVTAYIKRIYDERGQEDGRYLAITAGANEHWVKSEEIPLSYKDKFSFSVDWRLSENLNSGGYFTLHIAQIRLYGEDGTFWTLNGNENLEKIGWVKTNAAFSITNRYITTVYVPNDIDELQDWATVSVEAPPLPVAGKIYILLRKNGYNNTVETYFSNLQFDYIPYIAGTYQKYSGQYDKVEQTAAYKANRDEEFYLYDSPKKLFKGAIKRDNGTDYVLPDLWTDDFSGNEMKLGKLLAYDEWNQVRKERVLITGATVKGFASKYSFLLSKVRMLDYSTTKWFLCLQEDYSVKKLEGRCDFVEVFDSGETNDYTTPHEFKYEQ